MQKSTTMVVPPRQRRLGAPFEIVGRHRAHEREFEMRMRIDAAGHDVTAAGVDDLGAGRRFEIGADRGDRAVADEHVGAPRWS